MRSRSRTVPVKLSISPAESFVSEPGSARRISDLAAGISPLCKQFDQVRNWLLALLFRQTEH